MNITSQDPLDARGYRVLDWNTRCRSQEDLYVLEQALDDIRVGCQWLKIEAGVKRVVFIGYSRGLFFSVAYQVAEHDGPSLFVAEALIFLNSHRRRAEVHIAWLDLFLVYK